MARSAFVILLGLFVALNPAMLGAAQSGGSSRLLKGAAAYGGWRDDAPGVRRLITPAAMPPPHATASVGDPPRITPRPGGAMPQVPPGFVVTELATGLTDPRVVQVAPNGDIFVAESFAGRIMILPSRNGVPSPGRMTLFASGLNRPFGIAFWPPGPNPNFIYVADTNAVIRFPYRSGDFEARTPARTLVKGLPTSGHWTRDIVFSGDGSKMFVSIGSLSNNGTELAPLSLQQAIHYDQIHGGGAAWGLEARRADVLEFSPDGADLRTYATGLRNCAGMAMDPLSGDLWCAVNERDDLGDNLPPDYVTRVRAGGFYGWPWYYIGSNQDPDHKGQRPDLKNEVITPDVLIQPHSAPLQMTFYDARQFPSSYWGNAFVTLHGSWNRSPKTGYKVVEIILRNGVPTGEYEDFMTGFVASSGEVWGRPVGIAVAGDGSLLVTDDANGTLWRISYKK